MRINQLQVHAMNSQVLDVHECKPLLAQLQMANPASQIF